MSSLKPSIVRAPSETWAVRPPASEPNMSARPRAVSLRLRNRFRTDSPALASGNERTTLRRTHRARCYTEYRFPLLGSIGERGRLRRFEKFRNGSRRPRPVSRGSRGTRIQSHRQAASTARVSRISERQNRHKQRNPMLNELHPTTPRSHLPGGTLAFMDQSNRERSFRP